MTTFHRARTEEQRAQRSQTILDTAASMLAEMPVAELSLNELSRRVGLAKSNVLRYFESREAVLLELVHTATRAWLADLASELDDSVDTAADVPVRTGQIAHAFADSLGRHPLFCELISAQAAVLERNVSTETALRFKRTLYTDQARLASLLSAAMPELDTQAANTFATYAVIMAGALWIHTRPTPAVLAAFDADPEIRSMHTYFDDAVADTAQTLLAGTISRAASDAARQDGSPRPT